MVMWQASETGCIHHSNQQVHPALPFPLPAAPNLPVGEEGDVLVIQRYGLVVCSDGLVKLALLVQLIPPALGLLRLWGRTGTACKNVFVCKNVAVTCSVLT
jgi:hypothetical protein